MTAATDNPNTTTVVVDDYYEALSHASVSRRRAVLQSDPVAVARCKAYEDALLDELSRLRRQPIPA